MMSDNNRLLALLAALVLLFVASFATYSITKKNCIPQNLIQVLQGECEPQIENE